MPSSRIVSPSLGLEPESYQTSPKSSLISGLDNVKAELSLVNGNSYISLPLWDLPLRLFHWSLVVAVLVAIVSAKVGGEWMALHGKAGLFILGLVSFRLVWGLVGTQHARFINFFPTVSNILAYLQGRWQRRGHNPLGAMSVLLLLMILLSQALGGLFADDEIGFTGPMAHVVDTEMALKLTAWHQKLSNVLIVFLILHVLAIVFYRWFKKKNLVSAMITGHELVPVSIANQTESNRPVSIWALVFAVAVAVAITYAASIGFGTQGIQASNSGSGGASSSTSSPVNEAVPAPTPTW